LIEMVVRKSPDGIFAIDGTGSVTVWNPGMERLFGLPAAAVVGRLALEVLPHLAGVGEEAQLLRALEGEEVYVAERAFTAGGSGRMGFFEARYLPATGESGVVEGVIGFIRDVTGWKEAVHARLSTEARYQELFENANDMVYTLDLEGRITSLNKAAERMTGYTRNEALQMKLTELVAGEQRGAAEGFLERQLGGEAPGTLEVDIVTRGGSRLALEISSHLIRREGKAIGLQGIGRDVTERKKTEEALQQAKVKLEGWVRELEQRTREMTLLSEMGDMLRACITTEEAYSVIVRVAQQIFPVEVGALYVIGPSRNLVEAVALWGEEGLAERVFAPDDCWALRRGRVHWVEDAAVGLVCRHVREVPADGYLCVPMMAQSEALGVLHLTQPRETRGDTADGGEATAGGGDGGAHSDGAVESAVARDAAEPVDSGSTDGAVQSALHGGVARARAAEGRPRPAPPRADHAGVGSQRPIRL